jgi:hypothetical protein
MFFFLFAIAIDKEKFSMPRGDIEGLKKGQNAQWYAKEAASIIFQNKRFIR